MRGERVVVISRGPTPILEIQPRAQPRALGGLGSGDLLAAKPLPADHTWDEQRMQVLGPRLQ